MHEEFASERRCGHQNFAEVDQKMFNKVEEGFRTEQQDRQQAQSEIMKELRIEENARQMVQKDLEVRTEEMKNLKKKGEVVEPCVVRKKALEWVLGRRAP